MWTSLSTCVHGLDICMVLTSHKHWSTFIDTYYREEEEEREQSIPLVKLGYGELHFHHPCRVHCWGYSVSTTNSNTTTTMETFKQKE